MQNLTILLYHDHTAIFDVEALVWTIYSLTLEVVIDILLSYPLRRVDNTCRFSITIPATKDWDSNHIIVTV